jgi:hypothetical protein
MPTRVQKWRRTLRKLRRASISCRRQSVRKLAFQLLIFLVQKKYGKQKISAVARKAEAAGAAEAGSMDD